MVSMSMGRIQGEGNDISLSPTVPGEAKTQISQVPVSLQETFIVRLGEAVAAVEGSSPAVAGCPKGQGLVSAGTALKVAASQPAKSLASREMMGVSDGTTTAQQASAAQVDGPDTKSKPGDNQPQRETDAPTIVAPVEDNRIENIPAAPLAEPPGKNSLPSEGAIRVREEQFAPSVGEKRTEVKKAAQIERINTASANESAASNDIELHTSLVVVTQPDKAVAESGATSVTKDSLVRINKSDGTKRAEDKRSTTSISSVTLPTVVSADLPRKLSTDAVGPVADFKEQLLSDAGGKSVTFHYAGKAVNAQEDRIVGVAVSTGLNPPSNTAIQGSALTIPSSFDKTMNPTGFVHPESEAVTVFQQIGNTNGIASTTSHDVVRTFEPGLNAPTALEIGMSHGAHGWLKVRAEMENGVVSASLSSGTASGQQMLHRELSSLTAFLHQEKLPVSTVIVKDVSGALAGGAGDGTGSQRQGRTPDRSSEWQSGNADDPGSLESMGAAMTLEVESVIQHNPVPLTSATDAKGGWLNVHV